MHNGSGVLIESYYRTLTLVKLRLERAAMLVLAFPDYLKSDFCFLVSPEGYI
jgi:hypothetical protein